MWDSWILTLALGIVRNVVKNPEKKAKFREVMLNIRDAINAAFE
jgi:hypothetical protein